MVPGRGEKERTSRRDKLTRTALWGKLRVLTFQLHDDDPQLLQDLPMDEPSGRHS